MKQTDIFQIEEVSLIQLQMVLDSGKITSKELVLSYFERIAIYDKNGPSLNSVCEINPEALFIAEALDLERKKGNIFGPLHGIPILLKDNINTGDQMQTTAGSLALEGNYAAKDAFIVQKLRASGAIILGKTNMTEWANFMAYNMPSGYSSRSGQVLNPYGPGQFDVSGSSSGSAAAVAANFCAAAIGTETSGSIVSPASHNNIVGIKPTVGLVSRTGIIPISISQDTAGPMARSVEDAALLLEILAGRDEEDSATWRIHPHTSYTDHLKQSTLNNKRIGVSYSYCTKGLSISQKQLFDECLRVLKEQGAKVIMLDSISPLEQSEWDFSVLLFEFKSGLNAYLNHSRNPNGIQSLKKVIEFNENHAEACLRYGQELLKDSENTKGTLAEPVYLLNRTNDVLQAQTYGIQQTFETHDLDAVISPADTWYGIPAKAGYPSVAVPAGFDEDDCPFGVIFSGLAFEERKLIEIAYVFEQTTNFRRPPVL